MVHICRTQFWKFSRELVISRDDFSFGFPKKYFNLKKPYVFLFQNPCYGLARDLAKKEVKYFFLNNSYKHNWWQLCIQDFDQCLRTQKWILCRYFHSYKINIYTTIFLLVILQLNLWCKILAPIFRNRFNILSLVCCYMFC